MDRIRLLPFTGKCPPPLSVEALVSALLRVPPTPSRVIAQPFGLASSARFETNRHARTGLETETAKRETNLIFPIEFYRYSGLRHTGRRSLCSTGAEDTALDPYTGTSLVSEIGSVIAFSGFTLPPIHSNESRSFQRDANSDCDVQSEG